LSKNNRFFIEVLAHANGEVKCALNAK